MKVLFIGSGEFLSHVTRLLLVAKALHQEFDVHIEFALNGRYAPMVKEVGFNVTQVPDFVGSDLIEYFLKGTLRLHRSLVQRATEMLKADRKLLREVKPDLIVFDTRWSIPAAAWLEEVPTLAIASTIWTHYRTQLLVPDKDRLRRASDIIVSLFSMAIYQESGAYPNGVEDLVEGNITLLADLPSLLSEADNTAVFIGPLVWDGGRDVSWPPGNGPKAYVTGGSTTNDQVIFKVAEQLIQLGWRVVVTGIANSTSVTNTLVRRADVIRASSVLPDADLVVSHGGSGSLYQALEWGVPCAIFPSHLDTQIHGYLVERAGAGLVWQPNIAPLDLIEQIRTDHKFRTHANTLAQEIAKFSAPQRAAQTIIQFIDNNLNGASAKSRPLSTARPRQAAAPDDGAAAPR